MAPRFSPDGRKIAFNTRPALSQDLFIYDIPSETMTRLTSAADLHSAEWSPDGKRIAYTAIMDSTGENMYAQPADGSGAPEVLVGGPGDQYDGTWTPDGKSVVFAFNDEELNATDIGLAVLNGERTPTTLISGPGQQLTPRVSARGDLITYISSESGRYEIYVTTFPTPSARVQVSAGGGIEPMWSRDGRELFYRDGERMMVARVSYDGEIVVSNRRTLFEVPFVADGTHTWYDVSRDGERFVMLQATSNQTLAILNWDAELARAPAR
jgi:Tol biopolymer transport system component